MRAVLGFLFLLSGFTLGYLVLSGKLPNGGSTSPTPTPTPTPVPVNGKGTKAVGVDKVSSIGTTVHTQNNDGTTSRGYLS